LKNANKCNSLSQIPGFWVILKKYIVIPKKCFFLKSIFPASININAMLYKDFDVLWSSSYIDFIKQSEGGRKMPTHTIAALSAMKTDDIEDCFYPPAEYKKLLNSQKEVLKLKCKA
jgi:hypothetical protein